MQLCVVNYQRRVFLKLGGAVTNRRSLFNAILSYLTTRERSSPLFKMHHTCRKNFQVQAVVVILASPKIGMSLRQPQIIQQIQQITSQHKHPTDRLKAYASTVYVTYFSFDIVNIWAGTACQSHSTTGFLHHQYVGTSWAECQHILQTKCKSNQVINIEQICNAWTMDMYTIINGMEEQTCHPGRRAIG